MGHREIALIICGCIIFISVTTILIKYFMRHKKNKLEEKVKEQSSKIASMVDEEVSDSNKSE